MSTLTLYLTISSYSLYNIYAEKEQIQSETFYKISERLYLCSELTKKQKRPQLERRGSTVMTGNEEYIVNVRSRNTSSSEHTE